MAEQIDSLFVRLGLETDQQQFQQAESMFTGLQSTILQFGATIGAGIGLDELTRGFSETISEIERFADLYSTTPQFVESLKFAFGTVGGSADDAFESIRQVRDLLEQTEWGEIPSDAFRVAGFDPRMLEGVESVAEAHERIAAATAGMEPEKARRALSKLGFGEEAIRMFRLGAEELSNRLAEGAELSPITRQMTEQAVEFDQAINRFTTALDGVKNEISTLFVGDMADTIEDISTFLKENRDEIKSFAEEALPYLKNIAGAMGVLVGINIARSSLGIFKNIPFLTGATAAGLTYAYRNAQDVGAVREGLAPGEGRSAVEGQRSRMERMGEMPEGLTWKQQQRWMQGGPQARQEIRNEINVDARGASNPQEVEEAARRGTQRALEESVENTERDLSEPLQ